jgi:hypothetical protein
MLYESIQSVNKIVCMRGYLNNISSSFKVLMFTATLSNYYLMLGFRRLNPCIYIEYKNSRFLLLFFILLLK